MLKQKNVKKVIRVSLLTAFVFVSVWCLPLFAKAADKSRMEEQSEYWKEYEYADEREGYSLDQQMVWDLFSLEKLVKRFGDLEAAADQTAAFPAKEIFAGLMSGKLEHVGQLLLQYVRELLLGQKGAMRRLIGRLLLLAVAAVAFRLIGGLFPGSKVAELGDHTVLLLMLSILLLEYRQMTLLAEETLHRIEEFIPIFVPAFIASIGIACGVKTAVGYQSVLMGITYLIVRMMGRILLPLVYVYLLLTIMDAVWQDDRMSMTLELIKRGIEFALKVATRVVAGIGLVQALIFPVMDSLQGMALQKMVSILPGLGNLSDQVFKMFVGSCVLIKNCLGIFIVLLLLALCLGPLLRLLLFSFTLKGTAALMGILGEKQVVKCMGRLGEACMLLGRIVTAAVLMLFLLLSIACYLKGCV